MDQNEQLSPVWKSLPVEIVLEILDCFIEDILNACRTYSKADYNWFFRPGIRYLRGPGSPGYYQPQGDDAEKQATRALLTAEAVLRQGCDLFNSHKPRIERYFRDEWLSTMVFLVCVDSSRGYYYRYFSVPQQTQDDHTSSVADTRGKATFFLHTPAIIMDHVAGFHFGFPRVITRYLPEWTHTLWVPLNKLNEQQGLHALLTVWENHKNDSNILNVGHPLFMVGSIPSELGIWDLDERFEVPMDREVLTDHPDYPYASPIKFEGLEVHDGGRRIRFNWHNLIPEILHTTYAVARGNEETRESSL